MEYRFCLTFRLASTPLLRESQLLERLAAAGCTDALVGLGRKGYLALDFQREADKAEAAVLSAIRDVRAALPDAALVPRAGMNLADAAEQPAREALSRKPSAR